MVVRSRVRGLPVVLSAFAVVVLTAATPTAADEERGWLDVEVFTEIGDPGMPEGIAVGGDGTVYVGSHNYGKGDSRAPSVVWAFAPDGELLRTFEIRGQKLDEDHGILAIAADAEDNLYIIDRNPARVLRLDTRTGDQATYATFEDVQPCDRGGAPGHCSAGLLDLAPFPDYLVFGPAGTMYITDLEQALIWRVPPGGGAAEVWFTDARLEGVFGPNGVQFMADGQTLLFAQTGSAPPGSRDHTEGVLYELPVLPDGSPGQLEVFWRSGPSDGPDGLAIAESGRVYVALAGTNAVAVVSPDGTEEARVPQTPAHNALQEIPFDMPGSVVFHGQRVLVTNHSYFTANPESWAVLDVYAGEDGLPLFRPRLPPTNRQVQPTPLLAAQPPDEEPPDEEPEAARATAAALPSTGAAAPFAGVVLAAAGVMLRGRVS